MAERDEAQLPLFDDRRPAPKPDAQRLNLLALARVKGIGEATLKSLIGRYADLNAVWDLSPDELKEALSSSGIRGQNSVLDQVFNHRRELQDAAWRTLENFERQNIRLITELDEDYPQRLRETPDRPLWLFVQGDVSMLSMPNLIAVVGTRNATPGGIERARRLTYWLGNENFGIVSGLAEGIDQAAHQTALDYGVPTIAVLGTGIYVVFPAATSDLRKRIITQGGAIVSEYLPEDSYSSARFVRRNRIQAGISFATVPVEAEARSGTAHTYRFARDYRRITFGVISSKGGQHNGILELLKEDGRPIFDLDSGESLEELRMLLEPALHGLPPNGIKSNAFTSVIQEFERIVSTYHLKSEDFENLNEHLRAIWERTRSDSKGRDS